jgi:hypothetical protein
MTRIADKEVLAHMDELIHDLDERLDTPQGLMREHLTAARSYLLGSMPEEYQMTLELAKEVLPEIDQPQLRSRIEDFLRQQL